MELESFSSNFPRRTNFSQGRQHVCQYFRGAKFFNLPKNTDSGRTRTTAGEPNINVTPPFNLLKQLFELVLAIKHLVVAGDYELISGNHSKLT